MSPNFLSLPPEIKLTVARLLSFKDHYSLARVCQQNWVLFRKAVSINKLRNEYQHVDIRSSGGWSNNALQVFHRIISEPAFKIHTKSLNFLSPHGHFTYHGGSRKKWESWHTSGYIVDEERDCQLLTYYQRSPLQSIGMGLEESQRESSVFEHFMSMLIIISLPNLEELSIGPDMKTMLFEQLMHHNWLTPDLFLGSFQHLAHVQLVSKSNIDAVRPQLVHLIALLPSMRRIETIRLHSIEFQVDDYRQGKSKIQELIFQRVSLQAKWLEYCLPMYAGLQRFSCSTEWASHDSSNTRATIKALLRHSARSLLSLHLVLLLINHEITQGQTSNYRPYLSLRQFQKLQLLRCEWDEIVPDKSFQPQLESDYEFPLDSGRLVDILPDSLVILQIRRPWDKGYAEEQLIEYLESNPPKLRRIDWNNPSEALKGAARIANVELHPVFGYKGWSCVIGCDCD